MRIREWTAQDKLVVVHLIDAVDANGGDTCAR